MPDTRYRGRFAPSPTGPLHFGSLIAAAASYLQARTNAGEWWIRIEDIDPPREVAGASDAILRSLENFGFQWDGPVIYQSQRGEYYRAALASLQAKGLVYPCACSRRELANHGGQAEIYPGTCRKGLSKGALPRSWRLRVPQAVDTFQDAIQGPRHTLPARELGDFVLWRADGLVAYQLATAFDDAEQGMTEVVRGADLLDSTPRQRLVQQALDLPNPNYAHHPVATGRHGDKLSKQNLAPALDPRRVVDQLHAALSFLGQNPPTYLRHATRDELWVWAQANWNLRFVSPIHQQAIEHIP